MSHFNLISSTKASDVIPVKKYVSEKTGLTVIIASVEGPLVNGFFCLATEAHDDDGLPHTLEHLIFLGSEKYPYKGILDLLANRCMANGTNAWTDTDHTCYTIYTAGDEGMLTLLPIYLDHILWPTLTEEGFITEVHHIDGEGEDAGVVYCEMQGRENSADSRCNLQLLRAMYPDSGYSAETGGIMENLRISTDNRKVRNFHKEFYRPENLTIILTGLIDPEDVFRALEPVEHDIIAKREKEPQGKWVKPWQTIPPPALYGEITEQWPADTEDCGQVLFGWRGPVLSSPRALKRLTGCAILLRYLCDTPTAPLQRCLVEREDALAGDVSYNLTENIASMIKIELDNVPVEKLQAAKSAALECVQRVRSGDEPLQEARLTRLVRKQLREVAASLEAEPHSALAFPCIADALYSQDEQDFISRLNPQIDLHELLKEPVEYWLGLLQEYFTDDVVIVVGSPSIELQAKMAEEEKKIIEKQRSELGESGLAEKAKQLEDAIKFNEREAPSGTLAGVPVPRCDRLRCHEVRSWSPAGAPCPHFDLASLPLYARVHHLNTNLVYMNIVLDTSGMESATRRWVPLVSGALGECGVRRGALAVSHDAVSADTERLTVAFGTTVGFGRAGNFAVGLFGDLINVHIRCEPEDYEEVVNHAYEILYASEITKERLLVFTQRLINDVAQVRRNGSKMVYATLRDSLYSKESNMHWCSVLRQQKFLKELMEQLNAGGDSAEAAVAEAKRALKEITRNVWLHLATDFERYKLSVEPWMKFGNGNEVVLKEPSVVSDAESMSGWGGGFVVGVGGVESSFAARLAPGPRARSLADAPLRVALHYFTQLEGPMWRLIRGSGLSYGYGLVSAPEEGCIAFSLYKATNAVAAYAKAKTIVEEFLSHGEFDEDLFLSAKSTALFEVVEAEKCPADVVSESLMSYLRGVDLHFNRELVRAIAAVTAESAREAARRWLPTLFDEAVTKMAVVCHPTKVADVQAAFSKIGVRLEAFESMEVSHFNK